MWTNMVQADRPQTTWLMRIAYWNPKATNTHSHTIWNTAFPRQQWLRESAWMLRNVYIACLVNLGTLWRWLVNCLAPGERAPVSLRIGGYVDSRGCLDVLEKIKMCWYCRRSGRDSWVGITTHYALDGPVIESRGARLSAPVQTIPGVHPASCTMGIRYLSWG